jgi:hypothetical protein
MPLMFFFAHKYLSFLEVTQDFFAGIAILIWAEVNFSGPWENTLTLWQSL